MRNRKPLIVGGLTLALLGVCLAIVAVMWLSVAQLRASGVSWRIFSVDVISAEGDEEQRFAVSGPATFSVEDSAGDVTVTGGTGDEIVVSAHKTAWGSTQAEAEVALAALRVIVTQNGNAVTVRVEQPVEVDILRIGPGQGSVDFTITVPVETAVKAHTHAGDVTLSGTAGEADLRTDFGDINAMDVNGALLANTSSGEVVARRIRAETAKLDLHSDFGDVTLESAAAEEVKADSNSGAIRLAEVEAGGEVTLSSGFGKIEFESGQAASLTVETNSGEITLTGLAVGGLVKAHSDFGGVALSQVEAASYDLSTNSGTITVDGANGPVTARSDFGNIEVTGGEDVDLDLKTNSGTVTFAGSLGAGPHTLESDFGGLQIRLPPNAALTFDLKTDFGKVKSDFPVTLNGELSESRWRGTINGGGASLTATTNSGDISIEMLNP